MMEELQRTRTYYNACAVRAQLSAAPAAHNAAHDHCDAACVAGALDSIGCLERSVLELEQNRARAQAQLNTLTETARMRNTPSR